MPGINGTDFLDKIDRFYKEKTGKRMLFPEKSEDVKKPPNKQSDKSQSSKIPAK